ncbi:MAG TPA: nucleoside hydrolase [Phycisphaerae bacterium]|nr:nucleoside hydrolase [Phycisphaerae bacterium]
MATPVLIDTDMGIDDAVAVSLALASKALDVRALVAVGGNTPVAQVVKNIGRLLKALSPPTAPIVGVGLDPQRDNPEPRAVHGTDGFGDSDLPEDPSLKTADYRDVYEQVLNGAAGEAVVIALGPLTNLAKIISDSPDLAAKIKHIHVMGGAVWARGSVNSVTEFNFQCDPPATEKVLSSGLPVTVAPLDVTNLVQVDDSHVSRMAASGYRTGEVLAKLLRFRLEQGTAPGHGKAFIHDAVAVGGLLWPELFLKTKMRLDIVTTGPDAGRSKPALGGAPAQKINLLTAVNAADLLENLLESLCHEAFVV